MNWNQFLQVISPIPRAFWGLVAGASFMVLAAWLISRAWHERQLKAHAKERELQRVQDELAARRQVLLPAAEALTIGMNCIMRFAELELPDSDLTAPFVEMAPAIDKLFMVASTETVTAVNRLSTELNAAYSRLHIKRLPLALQKAQLEDLADAMDSYTDVRKRSAEVADKQRQLLDALFAKQCELTEECVRESAALRQLFVAVVSGVRAELGLGSSQHEIERSLAEGTRNAKASATEMLEKVRHIVATQPAEKSKPAQDIVVDEPMIAPPRTATRPLPIMVRPARRGISS